MMSNFAQRFAQAAVRMLPDILSRQNLMFTSSDQQSDDHQHHDQDHREDMRPAEGK